MKAGTPHSPTELSTQPAPSIPKDEPHPTKAITAQPETHSGPGQEEPITSGSVPKVRPRLVLPEPGYPTKPISQRDLASDSGDGDSPESEGNGPVDLDGKAIGPDRGAIPYYRPSVQLAGLQGREWIVVKFKIQANGRFQVEILEGTGDIHRDARVLTALRRWKWLPMRIDGVNLESVEIVRLFRREVTP